MKKSFVLYTSYLNSIRRLSNEQAGILFRAILTYEAEKYDSIPEMDDVTQMAFSFIQQALDENAGKYEKACEKRRARAKTSGRTKAEAQDERESSGHQKKQTVLSEIDKNLSVDNTYENEYDNDYGFDNDYDFEIDGEKEGVLTDTKEKGGRDLDTAFDEFWELYPKKIAKVQAEKAWDKLSPAACGTIMEKLPAFIESALWQREGGRYIPYASTWLNEKGWEEDPLPS